MRVGWIVVLLISVSATALLLTSAGTFARLTVPTPTPFQGQPRASPTTVSIVALSPAAQARPLSSGNMLLFGLGEPVATYSGTAWNYCDIYESRGLIVAFFCVDQRDSRGVVTDQVAILLPIITPIDKGPRTPLTALHPGMASTAIEGGYFKSSALAEAMPAESAGLLGPGTFYVMSIPIGPGLTFRELMVGVGNDPDGPMPTGWRKASRISGGQPH